MPRPIELHQPNSDATELQPANVPYTSLLGKWHVVASTLPLWKDKKNVTITYSPIPQHPPTTFDDLVSYNKKTDPPGKQPSTVRGVDKLEEGSGARWKWRGKGWLMIASSHWQLLGYRVLPYTSLAASASAPPTDPEFVVTYFAATLFTPAGLDIYARHPTALGDEYVDKLTRELVGLGGECERLCTGGGMFRIPHD